MKNQTLKKVGYTIVLLIVSTFAVLDTAIIYADLFNNPKIGLKAYSLLKIFTFSS
jgi:hypothetical protein